jgi:hypothetical protein
MSEQELMPLDDILRQVVRQVEIALLRAVYLSSIINSYSIKSKFMDIYFIKGLTVNYVWET